MMKKGARIYIHKTSGIDAAHLIPDDSLDLVNFLLFLIICFTF